MILPNGRRLYKVDRHRFEAGEPVLIQGASGRGKTTFLHMLAGLFLPTEGQIEVDGKRLLDLNDAERCQLRRERFGIVFQKLNLLSHLTALENVELSGADPQAAQAALTAVKMGDSGNDRASVARVLAARPAILLADEPTSSLDDDNAAFVMNSLLAGAKDRLTVVVSHDHRVSGRFKTVIDFARWTGST
jgi:putative ABC transport system ATP-binding protein